MVVGRGLIGPDRRESRVRGFDVTLLELADQILTPLDREMARIVEG
jgi:NADPH-dependent 2,4-dienoyl-CoA reductase/sulfur reductase-like enzyme